MDVEISTAKQVDSNSGNGIKKFHIISRELEKFEPKHHHIVIKLPVTYRPLVPMAISFVVMFIFGWVAPEYKHTTNSNETKTK